MLISAFSEANAMKRIKHIIKSVYKCSVLQQTTTLGNYSVARAWASISVHVATLPENGLQYAARVWNERATRAVCACPIKVAVAVLPLRYCCCTAAACRLFHFFYCDTYAVLVTFSILFERSEFLIDTCLLYTSPSPRDGLLSRMPSSA